jgi:hypothetical protein
MNGVVPGPRGDSGMPGRQGIPVSRKLNAQRIFIT